MMLKKVHLRQMVRVGVCLLLALTLVVAAATDAEAARKKRGVKSKKRAASISRQVLGVNDPRYADIIMNPVTGEIYHQDSATERRYPASLTKMMTLYLLFEALAKEKTSLNAHLDVSSYAATMPQTNLRLDGGDSIPVEIAIKALVVRSANDVSVVVAEALGGDVGTFAEMMTKKARALGMKNTVFKNPNGLPNSGQYTTALDMAKLGIALKRDFPQYYDYFETRQFSWNGVTYYTHNRVMLRYAGTDGIKTGYIGASGFNVVSSVVRGGRPLMGTVMGGTSGGWRDNRMIELLDQSYQILAERGAARGKIYPENLPLQRDPKTGKSVGRGINAKAIQIGDATDDAQTLPEDQVKLPNDGSAETAEEPTPMTEPEPVVTPPPSAVPQAQTPQTAGNYIRIVNLPEKKPEGATKPPPQVVTIPQAPATPVVTPAPSTFAYIPLQAPIAPVVTAPVPPINPAAIWGIQVGAFSSSELAVSAANSAYTIAKSSLSGAAIAVAGPEVGGATMHRARLTNITERQARSACEALIAKSSPCFAFKAAN
jgi:D-alanyl-D-alanine carboxypeptidase